MHLYARTPEDPRRIMYARDQGFYDLGQTWECFRNERCPSGGDAEALTASDIGENIRQLCILPKLGILSKTHASEGVKGIRHRSW